MLLLLLVENKTRRGLCFQLLVQCHKCLLSEVATGKRHDLCDKCYVRCDVSSSLIIMTN
jgi:hypothetical protein